MELLHSGMILLYEPGGETPQYRRVVFCRDQQVRLSLLHSRHVRHFSDALFSVENLGGFAYGNQEYTVTKKISLDVVLVGSLKRIRVDFGIIEDKEWEPDVLLDTNTVQSFGVPSFALEMLNTIETKSGRQCEICLCPMHIATTHLSCRNAFHMDCLAEWITISRAGDTELLTDFPTCPKCRGSILPPSTMTMAADPALQNAVISCFPTGSKILSAGEYRPSNISKFSCGTTSMHIIVKLPGGIVKQCFIKLTGGSEVGITKGEFQAMTAIHNTTPELNLVAKPLESKAFTDGGLEKHFTLYDFVNMTRYGSCFPPFEEAWHRLTKLHRQSVSPTGQFGFHIQTYIGDIPQHVEWNDSWTSFFGKMLSHMKEIETEIRGPWEDDTLFRRILQEVVPRLIGALERDERKVKPSLIHGNIYGHSESLYVSESTVFYGPSSYFAHHEMEWAFLAPAVSRHFTDELGGEVQRFLDEQWWSEPRCERDDRLRLYQIYHLLIKSIELKGCSASHREKVCITMNDLLNQYGSKNETGMNNDSNTPQQGC